MERKRVSNVLAMIAFAGFFAFQLLLPTNAHADPVVIEPGYIIELVANLPGGCPNGIAIGPEGDIFLADELAGIWKVDKETQAVEHFAGDKRYCQDVTFDDSGNLYVAADDGRPRNIYKVVSDGNYENITTGVFSVGLKYFNGAFYIGNSGDGTITKFESDVTTTFLSGYPVGNNGPFGLAFDSGGNLYFVQHGAGIVWKSDPTGTTVNQIANLTPFGVVFVAVDKLGNVYVSDVTNAKIHKISNGTVTDFATGFRGKFPPCNGPNGLVFDQCGNLYVADAGKLWKISPLAPFLSCIGFDPPMDKGPVKVRKNRVLPLKAQLEDCYGTPITDADIALPPVLQVFRENTGGMDPTDVTDESLSAGKGTEGNQFYFDYSSKWHFNLMTKNYSAHGTYHVFMDTGDHTEYVIAPMCEGTFVIE